MKTFAFRLRPEEDLKLAIQSFAETYQIEAGFILTTVGSLRQATLRFANQDQPTCLTDRFEILSLGGTVSIHGSHLHLSLADAKGQTLGGHVIPGCIIYTTAEIVLGELPDLAFMRSLDVSTGYRELDILPRPVSGD